VLIARLIREDTMHELVRTADGRDVLRTFVHERDLDRELTDAEAGEWCETVKRCGGEVRRGVVKWPEKVGRS
jgi:hypothetical protein